MIVDKIDIIALDGCLEAIAIRSSLESFGFNVGLYLIGDSKQLVELFLKNDLSKIVIIPCHGVYDNELLGISVPNLSEGLEKQMPYKKIITADKLTDIMNLNQPSYN